MATTSFQKDFKLGKKQSDKFYEVMTKKVKPALDPDFESKYKSVSEYRDTLRRVFGE